jgi:ABC-type Na+ efflux pump permease subunit
LDEPEVKALDIALKDLTRSFRSALAVLFMFGLPLLITGMFYFAFGRVASNGDFDLPRTKVIVANLDEGGPRFQVSAKNIPGGAQADTMGELIVGILQSEDMADLVEVSLAGSAEAACAAVDSQGAQVAIIIPADFSSQFADLDGEAAIEFYQDPTLTIGPGIIRAILNRFMDGMSGVKIAIDTFLDEAEPEEYALLGQVVERYLEISLVQVDDLSAALLDVRAPAAAAPREAAEEAGLLLQIISPIMGGMMIFYAFFTGASSAQSLLKEADERTLPRLFTTPTPQATILTGKFLSVFLTVLVQMLGLIVAGRLIFGMRWGPWLPMALAVTGTVLMASSFGIFFNSLFRDAKQGGAVFGGVIAITGMLGLIRIFAMNSPGAQQLGDSVSLLVPQGWAVRGLLQAMDGLPLGQVALTAAVMLAWSAAFFAIGVWRFNKRYG